MTEATITTLDSSKHIAWIWQSNPNSWSKCEKADWSHFSDVENLIIEEAFLNKQPRAVLDGCYIDFKNEVQISNDDENEQRSVKRMEYNRENKHLREERFMIDPIAPKRSSGGQYGWISPFIIAVRRDLHLRKEQLPSKDKALIPMLVQRATDGIIEEGKRIGKQREAAKLAKMLKEKKDKEMAEVWQCCAYLYSLESFLYKTINEVMRLIGGEEHEQIWRSKVRALGPFCLLLWDDPFNIKIKTKMILYRGANLSDDQIATYEEMAKHSNEYRSFQAFTSCSRNRRKAEEFGNTLFIIDVLFAFTADLSKVSEYPDEEEELITPGVCFSVQSVKFNTKTKKRLIYLKLKQRFNRKYRKCFSNHPSLSFPLSFDIIDLSHV